MVYLFLDRIVLWFPTYRNEYMWMSESRPQEKLVRTIVEWNASLAEDLSDPHVIICPLRLPGDAPL